MKNCEPKRLNADFRTALPYFASCHKELTSTAIPVEFHGWGELDSSLVGDYSWQPRAAVHNR